MTGPLTPAITSATPSTSSVGNRLVKKLPGPITTASNVAIASLHRGMNRRRRLEPDARHVMAARVSLVDFDFAARDLAVGVFGAERRLLDADRPHVAAAAEQGAQAVDGGEKVAAVALHHRQQQVAAGVAAEPRVLERRQPREQHAARLAFVARQRQRAPQHVAGRQHAELVAQLAGAAARVEHRHDGVEAQPGIAFQTAEQARQAGAAAETAKVDFTKSHKANSQTGRVVFYKRWLLLTAVLSPSPCRISNTSSASGFRRWWRTASRARTRRRAWRWCARSPPPISTSCASRVASWHRAGCATPLLLTKDEFAGSLDAFPIEYGEILETHRIVFGVDPFAGLTIRTEDLRRECETLVKSHLVHLRENYVECRGRQSRRRRPGRGSGAGVSR